MSSKVDVQLNSRYGKPGRSGTSTKGKEPSSKEPDRDSGPIAGNLFDLGIRERDPGNGIPDPESKGARLRIRNQVISD